MKILQAVVIRRDGKWFAQACTQDGVVKEARGETLTEALDIAVAESTNYEQCPACAGNGYACDINGDEEKRSECETCCGLRVIGDSLALNLVDDGWDAPFTVSQSDACDARANLLIQAARELRHRARWLRNAKSVLDPIRFADVVKAVTP